MAFNDSMIYFVPPAESNWLFNPKNLHALCTVCSDSKRPRITTRKVRRKELPDAHCVLDLAKKSHHVSFPHKTLTAAH